MIEAENLNDAFPILMFPLRLETRFKSTGDQQQLWIRVFPDDCNIHSSEELLTGSELENAKCFWIEMWKAGGREAEERGAWRSLVNSHGAGRAAWIIEQYKPGNKKPFKPDPKNKVLVVISSLVLPEEVQDKARDYWAAVWLAKAAPELLEKALGTLIDEVGEARAHEIMGQYIPVNISDAVPANIENHQVLLEKLDLSPENTYKTAQTSWTGAAKAIALPDRFMAVLYSGNNKKTILFDYPVKDNLPVSPDPSLTSDKQIKKDGNGDLVINEDLKWMVDFEEAVRAGMGIRINLTPQEAKEGFDRLFVAGVRSSSTETDSKALLEKLLTGHFYKKDGFGLLKQGTPTNNTGDEPAGYSWTEDADESYERVFKQTENFENSDGQKLAECLGIDAGVLDKVPNASGRDQAEASAMNTALFPATLGYFMEEMMHPLFSDVDMDATKYFFTRFVSGRGPVPAIRIGKQPYGILPVTVYSRLRFNDNRDNAPYAHNNQASYLTRLHLILMKMDKSWDDQLPKVSYIGKQGDQHQNLMDVIGLHPNSVEFHQRFMQSFQMRFNQLNLEFGNTIANSEIQKLTQKADAIFRELNRNVLQDLNIEMEDKKLPILQKYFLPRPNILSGPLVDDVPGSETSPVRPYSADGKNYIEWLATSDGETLRTEDFGGNPAPGALLYLLLRHALMLAQYDAAIQLVLAFENPNEKEVKTKKDFFDPDFIHIRDNNTGKSKFDHLFGSDYSYITRNKDVKLVDHLYLPGVLRGLEETKRLRDTLDALNIIKNIPTDRLERLLVEHLDCCSYRIDAWKTGLVAFKLKVQRAMDRQDYKPSKGLYLGAYGWLIDVRPGNKVLRDVQLPDSANKIFNKGNRQPLQTDRGNLGYIHAPSLNQAATAAILRNGYESNKNSGSGNPFAINLTSDRVRIATSFLEGMRNGQSLSALLGYQFERGLHDTYGLGKGEADKFIYPLRKAFPLVADNLENTKSTEKDHTEAKDSNNLADLSRSIECIEANNVIDGLKLIDFVRESSVKAYPFGLPATGTLPDATPAQAKAINEEVARISEVCDAISDLTLAEQVYQVVQGNFERAAGNADAFSKATYPPAMDIINTPRSGVTLTQRIAVHFDAGASAVKSPYFNETANEAIIKMTPRAKVEPGVNKWLSSVFPNPGSVFCKVTYRSPITKDTTILVSQKDLGLQPIDLLYCLDPDKEQAMAELDDRISAYVHYSISKHAKTHVKINYTAIIDENDRTKISFFELAVLVKSLRKIVIGSKFLDAAAISLSDTGKQQTSLMDDIQLRTRIMDCLDSMKTDIGLVMDNIKSITGSTDEFKTLLYSYISDDSGAEEIMGKINAGIKEYITEPTIEHKKRILDAFKASILLIGDTEIVTGLTNGYETRLDACQAEFSGFDKWARETVNVFLSFALYGNSQTGTGFINQGISEAYDRVISKLDKVIERWNKKNDDFMALVSKYNPSGPEDEQSELLQMLERIVSSRSTFPVPETPAAFKEIIDSKKHSFDILHHNLKTLRSNEKEEITAFFTEVESQLMSISDHDIISFDTDNNRNDLKAEKLMIVALKEDIIKALNNLKDSVLENIASCTALINSADSTSVNSDKISALLNAAKKLLGEEALIVPRFTLNDAQGTEFENAYRSGDYLLNFVRTHEGRFFPVDDWLGGVARVRDKVYHWENSSFLSNAFTPDATLEVIPLQFPFQKNDRWLAMKFKDEKDTNDQFQISGDKLLYTAHFAAAFDKAKPQCGIVLDEWTEVVPFNTETTGIAFHYDQPGSEPPQTMLLVVSPEFTGKWQWEDIIETLEETFQMAMKRAVEPSMIENYAQFLPAATLAVTPNRISIATNLAINNRIY